MDSVALAFASGAAAVLSLTTGLPSVLVGGMVALALLPPAATLGLTLGQRRRAEAQMKRKPKSQTPRPGPRHSRRALTIRYFPATTRNRSAAS